MTSALALALVLLTASVSAMAEPLHALRSKLDVPIVQQSRDRCGQAALEMVLRFHGAGPEALQEAGRAYDPSLKGSLITDLAAAARRGGYDASVSTLTPDSLIGLLTAGVPPIVLYQNGRGPVTVAHYGVVTGWDLRRGTFTLQDGRAQPSTLNVEDFAKRWRTAGSQALVVLRASP